MRVLRSAEAMSEIERFIQFQAKCDRLARETVATQLEGEKTRFLKTMLAEAEQFDDGSDDPYVASPSDNLARAIRAELERRHVKV